MELKNCRITFAPFKSLPELEFSTKLYDLKLNELKQSVGPVAICADLSNSTDRTNLVFSESSFSDSSSEINGNKTFLKGKVLIFNSFKEMLDNLTKITLENETNKILEQMNTNKLNEVNRFVMFCFMDLKSFKTKYTVLWPSLQLNSKCCKVIVSKCEETFTREKIDKIIKKRTQVQTENQSLPIFVDNNGEYLQEVGIKHSGNIWLVYTAEITIDPKKENITFGWDIRNIMYYYEVVLKSARINVLQLSLIQNDYYENTKTLEIHFESIQSPTPPKISGWETEKGKLNIKQVDFSHFMDPIKLAVQSNQLNLRLMKWRQAPALNVDLIDNLKVCIIGMGTLGCNIARNLIGWNISNLVLIDNGIVRSSNPVRQTLYNYEDTKGSPYKSLCAAESLKKINPAMNVTGLVMDVPMPGHLIGEDSDFITAVNKLDETIKNSNVVFLCTDSRESRWLPTLICASHNKVAINCALGFDTFLAMRHGTKENNLGCYFCNDVVVPRDSLSNRPLDEQCTISRPGLSFMASAFGVELLIQLLHLPSQENAESIESSLGIVPHMIRGSLNTFETTRMTGIRYEHCTACSKKLIESYVRHGTSFVRDVINNPALLSKISGIDETINLENINGLVISEEEDDW